jgi:hypothetical protein
VEELERLAEQLQADPDRAVLLARALQRVRVAQAWRTSALGYPCRHGLDEEVICSVVQDRDGRWFVNDGSRIGPLRTYVDSVDSGQAMGAADAMLTAAGWALVRGGE